MNKKSYILSIIGFLIINVNSLSFSMNEIFLAIQNISPKKIQEIVSDKFIDAKYINSQVETPLHLACKLGNLNIIEILLENEKIGSLLRDFQSSIYAVDNLGEKPNLRKVYFEACRNGNKKIISLLEAIVDKSEIVHIGLMPEEKAFVEKIYKTFDKFNKKISEVELSHDCSFLFVMFLDENCTSILINTKTKKIYTVPYCIHKNTACLIEKILFTRDEDRLIILYDCEILRLIDTETGIDICKPFEKINTIILSPDGKRLAASDYNDLYEYSDGECKLINTENGNNIFTADQTFSNWTKVIFSPNSEIIFDDGHIIDATTGAEIMNVGPTITCFNRYNEQSHSSNVIFGNNGEVLFAIRKEDKKGIFINIKTKTILKSNATELIEKGDPDLTDPYNSDDLDYTPADDSENIFNLFYHSLFSSNDKILILVYSKDRLIMNGEIEILNVETGKAETMDNVDCFLDVAIKDYEEKEQKEQKKFKHYLDKKTNSIIIFKLYDEADQFRDEMLKSKKSLDLCDVRIHTVDKIFTGPIRRNRDIFENNNGKDNNEILPDNKKIKIWAI